MIQLEGITLQMHAQPGASNLAPRRLTPQDIIKNNDTPLERLKAEVLKAIGYKPPRWSYEEKRRILPLCLYSKKGEYAGERKVIALIKDRLKIALSEL